MVASVQGICPMRQCIHPALGAYAALDGRLLSNATVGTSLRMRKSDRPALANRTILDNNISNF